MSDRDDAVYLWSMHDAALRLARHVEGKTFDDYAGNELLRDAVERCVSIIGEAARSVSDDFKVEHPEIPWPKIIGQRHRIIHEYMGVEHDRIGNVATLHVPDLVRLIEPLMPPLPHDPDENTP